MSEQSDTPRVYAVLQSFGFIAHTDRAAAMWLDTVINIARDIERELATATRERDEAIIERDENEGVFKVWRRRCEENDAEIINLKRERDALTAISEQQRAVRCISPTLADRMDVAGTYSIDDWHDVTSPTEGNP